MRQLTAMGPLAGCLFTLTASLPARGQTFSVTNFLSETVFTGAGTTGLDFGPTGILYLLEKRGRIMALVPNGQGGFQSPQVFADLRTSVDSAQEAGLLGIAVDPEFSTNRYIYVFYTTTTDQRVVRYTANAAGTSGSSPTNVITNLPRTYTFHKAGDIKFRPGENANIYIALGDDGFPDEARDLTTLRGKMLRVDKANGNGLAANPYYMSGGLTTTRARIWAIGFRNPFRIAFHPTTNTPAADVMYVSENGDTTDKLAWVRAGSDGYWSDLGDSGGFLNPPDANHKALFTGNPSHIGVAIAPSGPFSDSGTPVIYLSNYVFPAGGSILRFRLTGANLDTASAVPADNGMTFVSGAYGAHLQFGPDGALYWTNTGNGASNSGFTAGRIRYIGGVAPTASFTTNPSPPSGFAPLTVQFASTATDADGTIQSWAWDFGDSMTSNLENPSHTYAAPGMYTVTLRVTDDDLLGDDTSTAVSVVAGFNLTLTGIVYDGGSPTDQALEGTTQLRIYEADGTTAVPFINGLGPDQNGIEVSGGLINATVPVQVTGSTLTVSVGEESTSLIPQLFSFAVPSATTNVTQALTLRPSTTAIYGRVSDTRGDPAVVDIGVALDSLATLYTLSGGRDYLSGSGITASGIAHRVASDILGNYYLPLRDPGTYFLDIVGDTNSDRYISTLQQATLMTGQGLSTDITVGLQMGGAGCDDLTNIPATASVDYPTQIQPLWDAACIGCHRPNSGNGGYLDLTSANSFSELVNVASTQVPGVSLVVPNQTMDSYLLEKISCSNPQIGNRMRPGSPMDPVEQALVRDWIAQGAVMTTQPSPDAGFPEVGPPDTGLPPDIGPAPDAGLDIGPPPVDMGPAPDVGAPPLDAGVGTDSNRVLTEGELSAGCLCLGLRGRTSAGPAIGLLLIGVFSLVRHRRRDASGWDGRS